MTDEFRTVALDPGKVNSWASVWDDSTFRGAHKFDNPTTYDKITGEDFRLFVYRWLREVCPNPDKSELVVERYMHRTGSGGNVVELMNLMIGVIITEAHRAKIAVFCYTPSSHKTAYNKHHPGMFPRKTIRKAGKKYGRWMPVAKRHELNEHVMDSMTLGAYRILKRRGKL